MINPQVVKMKLGRPAEGLRSIVWADGIKERHMLLRAPSDWNATIAIDDSGDVKETFCVVVSPDGDGLKVIRMAPEELPKTLEYVGDDVQTAVGREVLGMQVNDIVESVRGDF